MFHNPSIPFSTHIPSGLRSGTVIHVDGHVPHHCRRFDINLMACHDTSHHKLKHGDIAFHLNPRFDEDSIVCNTKISDEWGREERHIARFPFRRGHDFQVEIRSQQDHYSVQVNGIHFCNYAHRIDPSMIGVLLIDGDVQVRKVDIQDGYNSGFAPAYPSAPFNPDFPSRTSYNPGVPAQTASSYNPGYPAQTASSYNPIYRGVPAQTASSYYPGAPAQTFNPAYPGVPAQTGYNQTGYPPPNVTYQNPYPYDTSRRSPY